jgi:hypothetical protein
MAFEGKAKADEKAQHTRGVCEHFEEAFNTAIERYMGFWDDFYFSSLALTNDRSLRTGQRE